MIRLSDVCYRYEDKSKSDQENTLDHISFTINNGDYVGIIGKTGSGKSTLLQQINGLLTPTKGTVYYDERDIHEKEYDIRSHHMKVALCFQYPEYQLFEETILEDICFGPKNQGLSEEECKKRARDAMETMGLTPDMEKVSPFMLSGGQQRKVALAGLLAMEPEVLILDEPAAGLDYQSKQNLFATLRKLNEEKGMTILLVSHDMDEIAEQARRIIVLKDGKIHADGMTQDILGNESLMQEAGLIMPRAALFFKKMREEGLTAEEKDIPITPGQLARYVKEGLNV